MTVMTSTCSQRFHGSGGTGPYTWTWRFLANSDIQAFRISDPNEGNPALETPEALTEGVDYTLTGASSYQGGAIVLTQALPFGTDLLVQRMTDVTQQVSIRNQGNNFRPEVHEDVFDRLAMMIQDRSRGLSSAEGDILGLKSRVGGVENRATGLEARMLVVEEDDEYLHNAVAALGAGLPSNALNDFSTTPRVSDIIIKESPVDPRAFMDGAAGRPTVTAWMLDGSVDVTTALQLALDEAGSRTVVPSWTWQSQTHNLSQGVVRLSKNKRYTISAPLVVPPGVVLDLNGATIYMISNGTGNGTGDAIQCAWSNQGYGWGNYFTGVKNGFIVGPGVTSTGRGLFLQMVNFGTFRNLKIKGFKFGCSLWEVQYSDFIGVHCHENTVNWYVTAQPAYKNLTSIDNWFSLCTSTRAKKYGTWLQCSTASTFDRWDVQKNGVVDVLIGAQLVGYIPTYTVTDGGSGYPANAKWSNGTALPVTIADANGKTAQAYAETNGGGVVTAVVSIDAGYGYTAPVVAVPGGDVAATVTANVVDDTGLGDWDGHSGVNRGKNVWNNLKVEHGGGERPSSGYAIIINDTSSRSNIFNDPVVQREPQTVSTSMTNPATGVNYTVGEANAWNAALPVPQFYRWMRTIGYGTMVVHPSDPSAPPNTLTNPAVAGDISIFRACEYSSLGIQWPVFVGTTPGLYTVDDTGTIDPKNGKVAYSAFTSDGMLLSSGYEADRTSIGASTFPVPAFQAKNTTPTTGGVTNQNSPSVVLGGRAFFDGADHPVEWGVLVKAVSGGSRGDLIFMFRNGGDWTQTGFSLRGDGSIGISALPVYADNAAAGDLGLNTLYRTPTGVLMVKY